MVGGYIKMNNNTHYDTSNIFAKIIRKEIPCQLVLENEFAMAFYDIAPKALIHVLLIPKGNFINAHHFHDNASLEEISGFYRLQSSIVEHLGLNEKGYRLISNTGSHGRQEVLHYHLHILGGEPLSCML